MAKTILNRYALAGLLLLQGLQLAKGQVAGCQALRSMQTNSLYYSAENLRSDTFDILKYTINLEIGNSATNLLKGNAQVRFAPKMNGRNYIRLDLLRLTVDSVKENSTLLTRTYNDTVLKVNFTAPKNTTDTSVITIYYHGVPQIDATGWGGFYFDNTQGAEYAYNLGVGFGASPHNYGRTWFPCFDNFVERSKYEFNITCDSTRRSYCNGQLISDVVTGANRTRKWVLNEQIPSYLASVAVAAYTQVNWSANTLTGVKPVILAAVSSDTSAMKTGFVHLLNCIQGFENDYGPYRWNRFGYCLVPFSSGAMEHATNISYPRAFIGNLNYEADLMAHELSHHWWGDVVTCETQEDMWINEGMATFSSYLFLEWQYGKARYLNSVKTEHDNLLHYLHKTEGGFRAISGVPHDLTYGDHVYKKGADVAHTLRGYMGDSAFFAGAKYTQQHNAFQSLNSLQFRDLMQAGSGQSLSDFYNNWVLSGGWPHFAIDSVRYISQPGGTYQAVISIKQKLFGAPSLYNNVPLEVAFFQSNWNKTVRRVVMSGATGNFTITLPFLPVYHALNYDSKISDASSHEAKTVKATGAITWTLGKVYTQVLNKGADSSLIRIVHNYVKPDPFKSNAQGHKLSSQHFWKVEGILSPGFVSKIRFNYDGNKNLSGTYAYLDTLNTIVNADSIRVFYRKDAADDWQIVRSFHKVNSTLRTGYIELDTLKLGEYTFGNHGDTTIALSIGQQTKNPLKVSVFPNPARHICTIALSEAPAKDCFLTLMSVDGKTLMSRPINTQSTTLNIADLSKGNYLLKLQNGDKLYSQKLLLD